MVDKEMMEMMAVIMEIADAARQAAATVAMSKEPLPPPRCLVLALLWVSVFTARAAGVSSDEFLELARDTFTVMPEQPDLVALLPKLGSSAS